MKATSKKTARLSKLYKRKSPSFHMQKEGMNKRGQDLSIGTLILIVLGIVVLVLLIFGFSIGWSNLWEKINIFGGGGSSLSTVATACNLAAGTNDKIGYCQDFKKIKTDGGTEHLNCQDTRLAGSIDNKLSCDSTTVNIAKKAICDSITNEDKRANTKINGAKYCATIPTAQLSCKGIGSSCGSLDTKEKCDAAVSAEGCTWS